MHIKNIFLGIAIIILTIFVTVYGISIFYPQVQYDDYCDEFQVTKTINTPDECAKMGGLWNVYEEPVSGINGYCDRDYTCRDEYENAKEARAKAVFYIAIPLGILILVLGGYLFGLEAVGAGLMGGGIGTIIYGAGSYWGYGGNTFRFILSLLGLAAVIFLSYWLNNKFEKKSKKKK